VLTFPWIFPIGFFNSENCDPTAMDLQLPDLIPHLTDHLWLVEGQSQVTPPTKFNVDASLLYSCSDN
jgi:hypothetical protein